MLGRSIPVTRPYKLPFESNKWGGAYFSGTDIVDYISVPDTIALRLNGNFSIFVRFIEKNFVNTFPGLISKGLSGVGFTGYIIFWTTSDNNSIFKRNNVTDGLFNIDRLTGRIMNYTFSHDNSGAGSSNAYANYISGSFVGTFPNNVEVDNLIIGQGDEGSRIIIYDIALFNQPLSQTNHFQLMEGKNVPTDFSCVMWHDYRLGHARDLSGNGNHGTLVGNVRFV